MAYRVAQSPPAVIWIMVARSTVLAANKAYKKTDKFIDLSVFFTFVFWRGNFCDHFQLVKTRNEKSFKSLLMALYL